MLKKQLIRLARKKRVRAKISGTTKRPRLSVYRSNTNIYAQIIDDINGKTLCAASDLKMEKVGNKVDMAKKVWEELAKLANEKGVKEVVFDRGGFLYHGRVKALADAAKSAGLKF